MPLYEYRCPICKLETTERRGFDDATLPRCPECDDQVLVRVFSRVSVVKSADQRSQDLSWVDKNLAGRLEKKASDKLNPAVQDALDQMQSD